MTNIPAQNIRLLSKTSLDNLREWTSISLELQNFIPESPKIEMQNTDIIFEAFENGASFSISRPITGHINPEKYEIRDIAMKSYIREDLLLDLEGDLTTSVADILGCGDLMRLTFLSSSIKICVDRIV